MRIIYLLFLSVFSLNLHASQADNKTIVTTFYNLALNEHKPAAAAEKYLSEKYVQHNPFVSDGKKPFVDYFVNYQKDHPDSRSEIKRAVAEGNLVVLHTHSTSSKSDLGYANMHIFKVEKGKIVEHWEVSQLVQQKSANKNTMF